MSKNEKIPNAWVVSSKDRGRKKIKKGNIYLNDREEFEIELHNPTDKNILAVINLDGKPISKTGLIVRRGERIYLDCFMDDKKKFLFETYMVDDTNENQKAINKNGILEVFFYNEKITEKYNPPQIIERHHYYPTRTYISQPYWYDTGGSFGIVTATTNMGNITTTASNNLYCNTNSFDGVLSCNFSDSSEIETGQVSKGDMSNQSFTTVDMDFESYIISSIVYNLLPESRKPKTKKDIKNKKSTDVDKYDLLMKITELWKIGALDKEEFLVEKAKIMGI